MAGQRKLGKPSAQRKALLRGQVTDLLNHGRIETTETRAKEVRSIAEKLITLAVLECENVVEVTKTVKRGDATETITVKNDAPSRLHARRQMMEVLYKIPAARQDKESKSAYAERTGAINDPVIEKLFGEIGPKYKKRNEENGQGGGYTRMLKLGPRRGDAAEMVILELI